MQIFQVDAFTKTRFTGNPATVILDADQQSEASLAAIAREFAHAETVFVLAPDDADHDVRMRFFNARKEAAFVGHATIAAHAVLLASNRRVCGPLRQKSGIGILSVTAGRGEPDADAFVEFRQTAPAFDPAMPAEAIQRVANALALPRELLDSRMPARIARKGASRLLLAVVGDAALNRLEPHFDDLVNLGKELGTDGFFVFRAIREAGKLCTYSRMFCPALGIPEDPVSGNAHAMLAAHLLDFNILIRDDPQFVGFQGEQVRRPGSVRVTPEIEGNAMIAARIGGHAVIVSAGKLA